MVWGLEYVDGLVAQNPRRPAPLSMSYGWIIAGGPVMRLWDHARGIGFTMKNIAGDITLMGRVQGEKRLTLRYS
jgi:hypothetical protein